MKQQWILWYVVVHGRTFALRQSKLRTSDDVGHASSSVRQRSTLALSEFTNVQERMSKIPKCQTDISKRLQDACQQNTCKVHMMSYAGLRCPFVLAPIHCFSGLNRYLGSIWWIFGWNKGQFRTLHSPIPRHTRWTGRCSPHFLSCFAGFKETSNLFLFPVLSGHIVYQRQRLRPTSFFISIG